MESKDAKDLFTSRNAKTFVVEAVVENCDTAMYFSKMNFIEQARQILADSDIHRYIPEYIDSSLTEEEAVDKAIEEAMNKGMWPKDIIDSEYEIRYTENYSLFNTPAITVNYWATDNSLDRWNVTCISLPENKD